MFFLFAVIYCKRIQAFGIIVNLDKNNYKKLPNRETIRINTGYKIVVGFRICHRIKLLPGGQCDFSRSMASVCCVSSVGRPLLSLCCDANLEPACMQQWVGVGIYGEQGLAFACCTKTHHPAWCPPPLPIHPLSPLQNPPAPPHLHGPSVQAASPAY